MAEDVDPRSGDGGCEDDGSTSASPAPTPTSVAASPRDPSLLDNASQLVSSSDHSPCPNDVSQSLVQSGGSASNSSSSARHLVSSTGQSDIVTVLADETESQCQSPDVEVITGDSVPDSQAAVGQADIIDCSRADGDLESEETAPEDEQINVEDVTEDEVTVIADSGQDATVEKPETSQPEAILTREVTGVVRPETSRKRHRSEIGASGSQSFSNGQAEAGNRLRSNSHVENLFSNTEEVSSLPRPRNPGGLFDSRLVGVDLRSGISFGRSVEQVGSEHTGDTNRSDFMKDALTDRARVLPRDRGLAVIETPVKWSSSINESVERPLPSSVVDSERVAKNLARLNSTDHEMDSHWSLNVHVTQSLSGVPGAGSGPTIQTGPATSPPERPRPPLRTIDPLPDHTALNRTNITSPDGSIRHGRSLHDFNHQGLSSLQHSHIDPTQHHLAGILDADRLSPEALDVDDSFYNLSPDEDALHFPASRFYKCRFCPFSAATYTQLQLHMPKHGGHLKALKCPLCDYTTNDKSNFRRHRRLHARNNPVSVLKCGKCSFTTILPRKIREHYQQIHNETGTPGMSSELTDGMTFTPQRFIGSRGVVGPMGIPTTSPSTGALSSSSGLHSMLINGHANGYPYAPGNNNAPVGNCMLGQYGTYSGTARHRQMDENHMASNYLRSIVSSIMNSHQSSKPQATSTITSSSFFLSPSVEATQQTASMDISEGQGVRGRGHDPEVKVKVEPLDCDGVSDVSSSATPYSEPMQDVSQNTGGHSSQVCMHNADNRLCSDNNKSVPVSSSSQVRSRTRTEAGNRDRSVDSSSPRDEDRSVLNSSVVNTTAIVKCETASVGIQCVLPLMKSELDLDGDYYRLTDTGGQFYRRWRGVDRAVQCDNNPANSARSHRLVSRVQSASESEIGEHHGSLSGDSRCGHCGICFDDEVMFSIHIGCHSHTDPFICNICGKQCGNKYGFYSHIMRGHHF